MPSMTTPDEQGHSQQASMAVFMDLIQGALLSRCLIEVADLSVADALGDDVETPTDLAKKVGADANALTRVLRLLATRGVFEDLDGRFRHTTLSRLLRRDSPQSLRGLVLLGLPNWQVLGSLGHSMRTGRPAVEAIEPGGIWDYLERDPGFARIFDEAMTSKSNAAITGILHAYDFSVFESIADIGGGRGHLIKAVLDVTPQSKGVLFDLPRAIEGAQGIASSRLTLQAGDFFNDMLPVCDAYLMMNVIHDWDDRDSVAILRAVRRVAASSAKLLLIEMLLPETPQPHPSVVMDTFMMAYTMGQERRQSHYQALLAAAEFQLDRIVSTASGMAIMESTPV
jgi:O-methyltransferase domain